MVLPSLCAFRRVPGLLSSCRSRSATMPGMALIPQRWQLRLVAASYAAVLLISTALVYWRYLQYVRHPEDVAASGGMWAGGDMMLAAFIACLLLIPTFFLVMVLRKDEHAWTVYSKVLLAFALTAPLSIAALAIPGGSWVIGDVCVSRIVAAPFAVVAYVISRIASRFRGPSRRIIYALGIEILTVAGAIVFLMSSSKLGHG